ncbi:3-hydroxyacyl-ACP dehydratase FabZ [Paraperlucidibaca wandonensis]|jgi:3-hydroxyacyl-[acyl-carrier-protein] dehydratase|uniref:3-hydroxyacyl-[acyl-carrier-protein] dehydratase FabZ n=1 Tax=Paraperlucidibaca wandonensis TaxID=1268273 RepID=A0ABW3HF18_9GAMM|tara:strand:+ start:2366 stop:2803 length:438 start_codon:yes stop_codon:yes gene_type:complete
MLDIQQVMHYLPQRYPFLFVDRVTEIEKGKRIVGYKNVTINEQFFQGHFPAKPIMPGVLMIEAMAQIAGILGFYTYEKSPETGHLYVFAGADNVRFKRQVVPGDQLVLEAVATGSRRHIYKFSCRALVDGQLAASADIIIAEQTL